MEANCNGVSVLMEERTLEQTIEDGFRFFQSNLHTITIGRITKVEQKSISVKPVIPRIVNGKVMPLPEIPDVPPVFLSGGGSHETWPLAVGDPCILFIAERATDRFFNGQDDAEPVESRMHDLSDCIALCGLKTFGDALVIPGVITRNGDMVHNGNITHNGNTTQTGDTKQTGTNTVTGDIILNGLSLQAFVTSHTHGGVMNGSGNTGAPN